MAKSYAYGPVPSRRLGLSLGVDTVAAKSCPFDCIYCQLGPTGAASTLRRRFAPVDEVVADVRRKLDRGPRPDHITLGGSGEPTLNLELGILIERLKSVTDVPVALLTGGALLGRPDVRRDAALADLVLPNLDAGDSELFDLISRPAPGITFESVLTGLESFRAEYHGRIWLEVMIVAGLTDTPARLDALVRAVARVAPDKVQLNTPVRPPAGPGVKALPLERLQSLCERFTPRAEVIAEVEAGREPARHASAPAGGDDVLVVLARRPCTLADLAVVLDLAPVGVEALVAPLIAAGRVEWAPDGRYLRLPG
jgi:wyosine [tRNA(Phe)-imidazoG37] synthetase (radical SAM superfamily)